LGLGERGAGKRSRRPCGRVNGMIAFASAKLLLAFLEKHLAPRPQTRRRSTEAMVDSFEHDERGPWIRMGPPAFDSSLLGRIQKIAQLRAPKSGIIVQKYQSPVFRRLALHHSFATHLLESGTDIRVVSALLDHGSIRTTTRYALVTEKLVRQTPSPLDLLRKYRKR
jgi:integrase